MAARSGKGFALIELMIVMSVIGVLGAIAVPLFGRMSTRAHWSKVAVQLAPVKDAVAQCLQANSGRAEACDSTDELTGVAGADPVAWLSAAPAIAGYPGTTVAVEAGPAIRVTTTHRSLERCSVLLTAAPSAAVVRWSLSTAPGCTREETGF